MFIDKKGVECRNMPEQVEKNRKDIVGIHEDIEDIYARLNLVNAAFIEIDDSELVGQGKLTEEQLLKLTTLDYVYIVMKRAEDVYLAFGGEKYQEGDTILKSMSAGGYSRVISIDLEAGTWNYYESDADLESLVQRVYELEDGLAKESNTRLNADSALEQSISKLEDEKLDKTTAQSTYASINSLDQETIARENGDHDLLEAIGSEQNARSTADAQLETNKLDKTKCTFQETAPTQAISDGGVHIVHLASSEGITEYNGYIYMYNED